MINISLGLGFLFSWIWYYIPFQKESLYVARVIDVGAVIVTAALAYVVLRMLKVRNNRSVIASSLIAIGNGALALRVAMHTYSSLFPSRPSSVEAIMFEGNFNFYVHALRVPAICVIVVGLILAFISNTWRDERRSMT